MKILISMRQLGIRGTDHSSLNFAEGLQRRGHRIAITYPSFREINPTTLRRAAAIAETLFRYDNLDEAQGFVKLWAPDRWYEKQGKPNEWLPEGVVTCVHAVFEVPRYGARFAAISPWLAEQLKCPCVPNILVPPSLADVPVTQRFGRHGGQETFDIGWVRELVGKRKDISFLNTKDFPGLVMEDQRCVARWIAAHGAMLHARVRGETFGNACGEFAIQRKPVLTWGGSQERAHIELLGPAAVIYNTVDELRELLEHYQPEPVKGHIPYFDCDMQHGIDAFEEVFCG